MPITFADAVLTILKGLIILHAGCIHPAVRCQTPQLDISGMRQSSGKDDTPQKPPSFSPSPITNVQIPDVWSAINSMRPPETRTIQELIISSVPGVDYPILSSIPAAADFSCATVNQPGFYADVHTRCQVFRRCDYSGYFYSYLCPNMTLFNQITLVCDWFFNVDCSRARSFYDYSNPRLYHDGWPLLDDAVSFVSKPLTTPKKSALRTTSVTTTPTTSRTRTSDRRRMRLYWGGSYNA